MAMRFAPHPLGAGASSPLPTGRVPNLPPTYAVITPADICKKGMTPQD